jgi:hypothetical protein
METQKVFLDVQLFHAALQREEKLILHPAVAH